MTISNSKKQRIIFVPVILIGSINIVLSSIVYAFIYSQIFNAHPSSRGWVEFFTLISSSIFILSGIGLIAMLKFLQVQNGIKYISVLLYLLIGILPLAVENQFTLLWTGTASTIVLIISQNSNKINNVIFLILNIILLVLNLIWSFLMLGV
jgi:hypothetical protein